MKKLLFFLSLIGIILSMPMTAGAQVKSVKIDCSITPYFPGETWSIPDPQKGGIVEFNPAKVQLIQFGDKLNPVKGKEILQKLQGTGCHVNVLDYLLEHQELIPVEWRGKTIVFWGTIYMDSSPLLCARNMSYWNGTWDWGRSFMEESCYDCFAIVIAK